MGAGQAAATIKQSDASYAEDQAARTTPFDLEKYDKPLDLTDPKLAAARKNQKMRAMLGHGRASTFLTGPSGDTTMPKLGRPTVLGGE